MIAATVLVVDDDDDVRRMTVAQLEALGYRTLEAPDGNAGLAVIDGHSPDLVLADFAMPGMNGADMVQAVRRTRPELPVIFASGYADTAAIEAGAGKGAVILRKPFRARDLQAAIARALRAQEPGIRKKLPKARLGRAMKAPSC